MSTCGGLTPRRGGHISVFCKGPIRSGKFTAYEEFPSGGALLEQRQEPGPPATLIPLRKLWAF